MKSISSSNNIPSSSSLFRVTSQPTFYGPSDENDIFHDALPSKSKAISALTEYQFFGLPQLLSADVNPLSVVTQDFKLQSKLDVPLQVEHNIYDFALTIDEVEQSRLDNDMDNEMVLPQIPFVLLPTHFVAADISITKVLKEVRDLLDNEFASTIFYDFIEKECGFDGVYTSGSKYCDFCIRFYMNTSDNGIVVEMQRLDKESCGFTFKNIFNALKLKFCEDKLNLRSSSFCARQFDTCIDSQFSDGDFLSFESNETTEEEVSQSINLVLNMIKEPNEQLQLEACRIICDLAEDSSTRQRLVDAGCTVFLVDLMKNYDGLIRLLAVSALAQLSECQECISAIITSGAMPYLLSYASDGPYKTAAMRRESARAIANVATFKAHEFALSLNSDDLVEWKSRIASLTDPFIRERSERANTFLHVATL